MSVVSKGRGKYRFNIIDVILIIVIAVSLASILFLFFYKGGQSAENDGENKVDIIYTVEQKELPDILRGKIGMGDSVYDGETGILMGQVIDVEYTDSVYEGYDTANNTVTRELYPGKIDVKVRISAEAVVDKDGVFRIDGCLVNVGKSFEMHFPFFCGEAVCVSVSEVSE